MTLGLKTAQTGNLELIVAMNATKLNLKSRTLVLALAPVLLVAASSVAAQNSNEFAQSDSSRHHWELTVSPYTLHWNSDPNHRRVGLVGVERHDSSDHSLWGLSGFSNSFGQPSVYAYYGHQWNSVGGNDRVYVKLSGGIIYGYKDEYADKVPFNHYGFAPVLIPAVGYRITPNDAVQAAVLGTAGVMFSYNRRF